MPSARDKIILTAPGANETTAHLSILINANRSIAPPPFSLAQEAGHVAMRSDPATANFGLGLGRGALPSAGGGTEASQLGGTADAPGGPGSGQGSAQGSAQVGGTLPTTPTTRTRRRRHLRRHVIRLPSQLMWQPLGGAGPSSAGNSSSHLPSPAGAREREREGGGPGSGAGDKDRSQSVGGASVASNEDGRSSYTVM